MQKGQENMHAMMPQEKEEWIRMSLCIGDREHRAPAKSK